MTITSSEPYSWAASEVSALRIPRSSSRAGTTTDTSGPADNGSTSSSDSRCRRSSTATSALHAQGRIANNASTRLTA